MTREEVGVILLTTFIGMTLGNFAYQWFGNMNWEVASERTFFQGSALLLAYIMLSLKWSAQ